MWQIIIKTDMFQAACSSSPQLAGKACVHAGCIYLWKCRTWLFNGDTLIPIELYVATLSQGFQFSCCLNRKNNLRCGHILGLSLRCHDATHQTSFSRCFVLPSYHMQYFDTTHTQSFGLEGACKVQVVCQDCQVCCFFIVFKHSLLDIVFFGVCVIGRLFGCYFPRETS